jgi:hypothetical protein
MARFRQIGELTQKLNDKLDKFSVQGVNAMIIFVFQASACEPGPLQWKQDIRFGRDTSWIPKDRGKQLEKKERREEKKKKDFKSFRIDLSFSILDRRWV